MTKEQYRNSAMHWHPFRGYAHLVAAVAMWLSLSSDRGIGAVRQESGSHHQERNAGRKAALLNPAAFTERAPETFQARFDTSVGEFVIEVHRDWAPNGADRFYNLVKSGFYDGNRFYRVTPLMAVWGLNGDPEIAKAWLRARISDDQTRKRSNIRGAVAFFQANRRTTHTFINLSDNSDVLDIQIAPFGEVVAGMDVVEKLYAGYGESKPTGNGPEMNPFYEEGNAYLEREFPRLDFINTATIVESIRER